MAAAHMQMIQAVICDAGGAAERLPSDLFCSQVASTLTVCGALCPAALSPALRHLLSQAAHGMSARVRELRGGWKPRSAYRNGISAGPL